MATLPVYRTWVAGEVVTAAYFNTNVRDAGNFFLAVPVFEGRQTVSQNLTSGAAASITFDTEDIDNDNGHSIVSNTSRYTPQTAGRFQHSGGVGMAINGTGNRWTFWAINGASINAGGGMLGGGGQRYHPQTMTSTFNGTGDYLELQALQNSGSTLATDVNTGGLGFQSRMSVRWVGTT